MLNKNYSPIATPDDPVISIKLPRSILSDLRLRAEENGRGLDSEIALRLARSLERDLKMVKADNALALKAFDRVESQPELIQFLALQLR